MVLDVHLGRRLCDCVAHGMENTDGFEFPRSVLGADDIAGYCLHGLNLACCLSLYTHCRIHGFLPFLQYLITPFSNNGLLTYRVTGSGGRGLKIWLGAWHPLCVCVIAAAVE